MRYLLPCLVTLLLTTSCLAVQARADSGTVRAAEALGNALKVGNAKEPDKALREELLNTALGNIGVANDLLGMSHGASSLVGRRFENLNLKIVVFDSGSEQKGTALGVEYSYQESIRTVLTDEGNQFSGLKGSFSAQGTLAFHANKNPRDFLESSFALGYFYSRGGVVTTTDDAYSNALEELEIKLAEFEDVDALSSSEEWKKFRTLIGQHLSDQYYLSAELDAGLESDQRFTTKQLVLGVELGIVPRGWGRETTLAKMNVFDYLPALLRVWSGVDAVWSPSGSGFPTLHIGFKRVLPQDKDPRTDVAGKSSYWRYDIETGLGSVLGRWKGGTVRWENNFRHYAEVDPNEAVETADLDKYTYFVSAVSLGNGMFMSYSTGKLPFDAKADKVYELGFDYRF